MNWVIVFVTKIVLLIYKHLFGRRSFHNNTSQQGDLPNISASTPAIESTDSTASTLPLPHGEYEVFLSFRGPDTRRRITDLLYRFLVHLKIRTFRDDDELRLGEGIWPELVRAIDQSKIYVLILSEGYAHSKWCLKELAEIVERRNRDRGNIVLPVFYMVDPRDVRHQTGPYEDAFQQHEMKFDERTIQNWKDALKEVGSLKGWHIKTKDEEGAIADLVSNVVWSHLSKNNYVLETDELIGIEDRVEEVVHKLSIDSGSVSTVGIHGTGGIGKTTLAMAVYNKISARFDRCSFLENIREMQQQKDGTLVLQNKLISNIMRSDSTGSMVDVREGRRIIKERVSQFKILVVLDDVDEKFKFSEVLGNFENFFPGSRFIVTSRDVKVLKSLGRDHRCELYEVQGMSHDVSLQLFCKHAFGMDSPAPGFETLSKDIVSTSGGLPLTLKVVGSSLFREEVAIWKDKSAQLKKMPEKEVMQRLKISYDALGHEAKQIFLDIACFFIGVQDREFASYMWSDCNFYPVSNINILIQKSMIKIDDFDEFQMHDQLRDMGREIVREENIEHPWMRSRIWSKKEATKLLLDKKGTNRIKAIRLKSSLDLENEHFSNMTELRYIEGQNTTLRGDFSGLLPNLRWLRLHDHEESSKGHLTNFHAENLVIFDFSNTEVGDDWGGWSTIKTSKKLKVLNLDNPSPKLTKLPEFPESGSLEILNLWNFGRELSSSDVELDIRNLWNLKLLNLDNCCLRKITGGTFGTMKGLRELSLVDINCTENLRESLVDIGDLPSLEILNAKRVFMPNEDVLAGIKLPTSLKKLSTSSEVVNLVDLLELRELELNRCNKLVIPATNTSWWESSKLESLMLVTGPHLIVMAPNDAGLLPSSLTSLCISYTRSERLPSLENLSNLTQLQLLRCVELREIRGLGSLKSLETLTISLARCLSSLDGLIDLMSSPDCRLTELKLRRCPHLLTAVDNSAGRELPTVYSLQELEIVGCPWLDGGSIPSLSKLPRLKVVRMEGILRFHGGILEGVGDLEELVELELVNLPTVQRLPPLSKLRELRRLVLKDMPDLQEIEGLKELKSLKELKLSQCTSLERFPVASLPSGLERIKLDLRGCTNFTTDLSSLTGAGDDRRREVTIRWPHEPRPVVADDHDFDPALY